MPTATHRPAGDALPRPLITIGVPCAGVLLIAFFLIRGFPYDKLGELIADRIERSHGIHLAVGDVGPALQLAGLALESTQLRVTFPDRSPQQIDRALIRPAWSLSWLTGEPTFHVELDTPSGSADGTLHWNGAASWVGTIRNARPDLPPISDWIPIGGFEGTLEAMIDISMGESGPEGLVEFEIRDGSIFLPGLSAALPFENLTGAASFGGDAYAKLTSLSFEGPLASGSGSGTIRLAEPLEQAPIGFEFQIVAKDEVGRAVRAGGLRLKSGGEGLAKISGTVGKPKIR
jgi:type II secretion system protein N